MKIKIQNKFKNKSGNTNWPKQIHIFFCVFFFFFLLLSYIVKYRFQDCDSKISDTFEIKLMSNGWYFFYTGIWQLKSPRLTSPGKKTPQQHSQHQPECQGSGHRVSHSVSHSNTSIIIMQPACVYHYKNWEAVSSCKWEPNLPEKTWLMWLSVVSRNQPVQ